MNITLIYCYQNLINLGIDMNAINSGVLFENQLYSSIPNYESWGYDFSQDTLLITIPDGIAIPDLSKFGEVVANVSN